jgi:aryl-alcohol dehydrogenase-like predicted oxidoreductase
MREELNWLAEKTFVEENNSKVKSLKILADEIGISLPHLGICWCLKNPNVSTVILGASKEEQLIQTLKSKDYMHLLTDEVLQKIELILNNKPQLPPY